MCTHKQAHMIQVKFLGLLVLDVHTMIPALYNENNVAIVLLSSPCWLKMVVAEQVHFRVVDHAVV